MTNPDTIGLLGLIRCKRVPGGYEGSGPIFRHPFRFEVRKGPGDDLTLAVVNEGLDVGPSPLVDGWGIEDEAPVTRGKK